MAVPASWTPSKQSVLVQSRVINVHQFQKGQLMEDLDADLRQGNMRLRDFRNIAAVPSEEHNRITA